MSGESVSFGFYLGGDNPFWIDRGGIRGFENHFFTDKFSVTNLLNGTWSMEGVLDRTILELFLEGGKFSATTTFYPEEKLNLMWAEATELPPSAKVSIGAWTLKSAWAE
jgi:beta-fructofuranosidase